MSKAGTARHIQEVRCVRRLRQAARHWADARFAEENDMLVGAAVSRELARDAEQRAEAELRSPAWPREDQEPTPLVWDYEARLERYLRERKSRCGPLAQELGEVHPRTLMWLR